MYHAATAGMVEQLAAAIGEENVGVGLPLEGTKRVAFGIPGGLVLAKHAADKDAAKKFAGYLASTTVAAELAKESGFFSARTDVTIPGSRPPPRSSPSPWSSPSPATPTRRPVR
ncbi:hypothetical protein GCM10020219_066710 [Nonomuraea dietziae]